MNHSSTRAGLHKYKVEPYVAVGDVYAVPPHTGRGGWTWYTGSAGWMYRAGIEGILGISREAGFLVLAPTIPASWPGFEAAVTIDSTRYDISVSRTSGVERQASETLLDGQPIRPVAGHAIRVPLDGAHHTLSLRLA